MHRGLVQPNEASDQMSVPLKCWAACSSVLQLDADTSEAEMDHKHTEGMVRAAECGDLQALYVVGSFYDTGE